VKKIGTTQEQLARILRIPGIPNGEAVNAIEHGRKPIPESFEWELREFGMQLEDFPARADLNRGWQALDRAQAAGAPFSFWPSLSRRTPFDVPRLPMSLPRGEPRFTNAYKIVDEVMRHGAASHPDNDWLRRSPEYHLARAEEHLKTLRDGNKRHDHVAHAATRLLMALTLREIG
jgi:hypothetical protein